MVAMHQPEAWTAIPIARIEDLKDGVYGAGLDATQMSSAPLSGNLAFTQHDGILYSSGLIHGQVALHGPLSGDHLTVGVGLGMGAGTRHWLDETRSGSVGVFHGGDEHDAFYTPGSLYATATLTIERLEELAAREGLVLDKPVLGGTGIYHRPLPAETTERLKLAFERIHRGRPAAWPGEGSVGEALLWTIIHHIAREPFCRNQQGGAQGHARIVARARAYIFEHLEQPIAPDEIARAAYTSRRTLFRAFADILDDTPQGYVRRLRLHRIRHDLASHEERACTIALIANQWGISELGRMASWYHELFGEKPSDTLSRPIVPPAKSHH
ncbi:helix-turn-helix domain-containing protein [Ensifer sp. NPDC090286]|uniref:helix-turn-helix domain-containing protein n=1 Tax=Ensifer sp. NPDC090286 TaxID=3363991 RepID=UPI00383AFA16